MNRLAAYLVIALLGLALSNIGILFLTTQRHEFLAKLAYLELIGVLCCFAFWAISATVITVKKNRQPK